MPQALSKTSVSMYADDSTLYTSAPTATEMIATLKKELQARNKLVLNISQNEKRILDKSFT
jgi:hypothetical protein